MVGISYWWVWAVGCSMNSIDSFGIMNSGDCVKSYSTFLKNTQNQAACRTVDKPGGYQLFWYSGLLYKWWQWSIMALRWSDN